MAAICRSWLVIQSVNRLIAFSVPWGLAIRNANGTSTSAQLVDSHENQHRDHRYRGGRLASDQVMPREEICGTRGADRRANEDGEPVVGLMQGPQCPAF